MSNINLSGTFKLNNDDVEYSINRNIVCIVADNGAGKSRLLKSINEQYPDNTALVNPDLQALWISEPKNKVLFDTYLSKFDLKYDFKERKVITSSGHEILYNAMSDGVRKLLKVLEFIVEDNRVLLVDDLEMHLSIECQKNLI